MTTSHSKRPSYKIQCLDSGFMLTVTNQAGVQNYAFETYKSLEDYLRLELEGPF